MSNSEECFSHLLIGALPPPVGGTTVLFDQLVRELSDRENINITVIDTRVELQGWPGKIVTLIQVIGRGLKSIREVDSVGFHGSINGAMLFFPILKIICFLYRRPLILRTFGGDFDERFSQLGGFKKYILSKTMLSSDMLLFETKRSVEYFKNKTNSKVYWYPNSRPFSSSSNQLVSKKLVHLPLKVAFVGHVKPSKGVRELVAATQSSVELSVDIYGPLSEGIVESELNTHNTQYMGILDPEDTASVIAKYDVLALPTYFDGEGYPGVILEAYAQAVPVISTNWRCIPEIVDDSSGILVDPGSVDQLKYAMEKLETDQDKYNKLCIGAIQQAEKFSSQEWTEKYYQLVQELN